MEQAKEMDRATHEEVLTETKHATVGELAIVQNIEDEPAPRLHSKTFLVVTVSQPNT